ncbi:MAG: sulfite exporter TauE/SafE family protein, partial [Pseudomonadota bacterium]
LGVVLVAYCLFALANPNLRLAANLEKPLAPIIGFTTGILNGLTGSQVMPVLPYLLSLNLEPNRFVQAINFSFTLSSLVMAAGLTKLGLMTLETATISACGLVLVWAGIKLGTRVRSMLSPELFRAIILVFLMLLGASLAVRWFDLF